MGNQQMKSSKKILDSDQQFQQKLKLINSNKIFTQIVSQQYSYQNLIVLSSLNQLIKKCFKINEFLWIDKNIDSIQNLQNLQIFKNIIQVYNFSDPQNAIKHIKSKQNTVTFRIIVSASLGLQIYKQLVQLKNVVQIHIFCLYLPKGLQIKKLFGYKIKSVSNQVRQCANSINYYKRIDDKFKILPNFIPIISQQTSQLNKLRYNLYWILKSNIRKNSKQDFIKFARFAYKNNNIQLENINKFDKYYQQNRICFPKIFRWYTKQSFYFKLLNNCIRASLDPRQLCYVRLPLLDLHYSIKKQYNKNKIKQHVFYRGGVISDTEIKILKSNIGNFIQILGFMSTSKSKQKAMSFTKSENGILFIIKVTNQVRMPQIDYGYVQITQYSKFPDQQQVLFNCLNVFQVLSLVKQNNIYIVKLKYGELSRIAYQKSQSKLISQKQQNIYLNYIHQQKIIQMLKNQGDVLTICQNYDESLVYYKQLLDIFISTQQNINAGKLHKDFARIYQKLAQINHKKGNYNQENLYIQKALKIFLQYEGQLNQKTAIAYFNLGINYDALQKFQEALINKFKYIKIILDLKKQSNEKLAKCYNSIGVSYNSLKKYDMALEYLSKALNQSDFLVNITQIRAGIYNNMGVTYFLLNNIYKSIEFYEKSLQIKKKLIGQNHISVADLYQNLADCYMKLINYDKAFNYYMDALTIRKQILGFKHISIIYNVQKIGYLLLDKNCQYQGINYLKNAYNLFKELENSLTQKQKNDMSRLEKKILVEQNNYLFKNNLKVQKIERNEVQRDLARKTFIGQKQLDKSKDKYLILDKFKHNGLGCLNLKNDKKKQ